MSSKNAISKLLQSPLTILEQQIFDNKTQIEEWLSAEWDKTPPPFYCSVDLRQAGYKLTPVDTNLFPAGFNNIPQEFTPVCLDSLRSSLRRQIPNPAHNKLLIIPEGHTRNLFYLKNVAHLQELLQKIGFEIRIGTLREDILESTKLELSEKQTLLLEPLKRSDNVLQLENFVPDVILLNHDLSEGIPDILKNLSQTILPPPELGWAFRRKSEHFAFYEKITELFAQRIGIDSWQINPYFRNCRKINFMQHQGEDCLESNSQLVIEDIQKKFNEYQISDKPFVFIKADSGTYGMGIMSIEDPKVIQSLNRKQRTKMMATKGKQEVSHIIIQEGVPTIDILEDDKAVAEPVIYLLGDQVMGGFYRIHPQKNARDNLNTPGMYFEPMPMEACCSIDGNASQRFYVYGVIARLAALAAAHEIRSKAK